MNRLQQYWLEQSSHLLKEWEKIHIRPSRRAVHDWRVAAKKTRALLRLLHSSGIEEEVCSFPQSLRIFYAVAGRYRDTEMGILLLHRISRQEGIRLPSFLQSQKAILSISRKQLRQAAASIIPTDITALGPCVEDLSNTIEEEALNERINRLSAERLVEVAADMKELRKQAHACRKKLKQVYYWLQLASVNTLFGSRQMRSLHKILEALGHWHDHAVLYQRIRHYRKTTLVKGLEEEEACRHAAIYLKKLRDEWLFGAGEMMEKLLFRQ